MSVVVAIKDKNRIYMGADTLMLSGDGKINHTKAESNFKISKLSNGVLIGNVGRVAVAQQLWIHDEWFDPLPEKGLTKEFLVTQVIPKYRKVLEDLNLVEDGRIHASHIVAWKDKMFGIMQDFSVVTSNSYYARGAGVTVALSYLRRSDLSVQERLRSALSACEKYYSSIASPFLFIDTENLEFTIEGE